MEKMAVFLTEHKKLGNFYDCSSVQVYQRETSSFELQEERSYSQILPSSPGQIRSETASLAATLKECSVVLFGEITGVPYSIFDGQGFYIFTAADLSEQTWKGICDDLDALHREEEEKKSIRYQAPQEIDIPGVYFFDLIRAQELNPERSSKQLLQGFINDVPFMELRLKVSHIPPWIEKDSRFDVAEAKMNQVSYVIITRKKC